MSHPTTIINTGNSRIDAVDALRGFALIGVGLVHVIEQYSAAPMLPAITEVATAGILDKVISGLNFFLMTGKFYIIFSLLFGLSFFIQVDSQERDGKSSTSQFAWRLLLLFLFGYAHHLIYRGDILMIYATLGVSLIFLRRVPTKLLLLFALAMFLGFGRYLSFAFFGGPPESFSPDSPEIQAYFNILQTGSLWDVMSMNNVGAFENLIVFQFGFFARGYITFGLFLIGICLGRSGFFHDIQGHRHLIKRALKWAGVSAVLSAVLMIGCFSTVDQPPTFTTWLEAFAFTFLDLFNLSVATLFACGFLLLITSKASVLNLFAPYGRMALTNYILQSIIGTFLFYGWGLGLLGNWPNSLIILLGASMAIGQIIFSHLWMSQFRYGPLEWLWRIMTLRQRVKILKIKHA
ncbi:MAG: DUF418 domain-containing protein [Acidiferrobacterales bacterium]|nr:DUF418 domain-containing protein [Acidiferrobacterales bacterium]